MSGPDGGTAANRRTLVLFVGLVLLVSLVALPPLAGRLQYARTRAELRAIRDAATVAELSTVGKLFTTLARIIGPTVVNVTGARRVTTLADEIASLRGFEQAGVVGETVGSGLVVREDGVIVTNYHVVARSETIVVALADGRRFPAELVGADAATDLAVLRIDATGLPTAVWGDSDTVEVGEMVWALGNPFGLDRTLTYGIVSAVGRRGVLESPYQEFLQTDAAINPGNSGGPLVDVHGHVMGITTAIVGQDYSGIGFAIPSNEARRVSEAILASGAPDRGYLGLSLKPRPAEPGPDGAQVVAVEPGSPAALAGVQAGDVIVAFDGDEVGGPAEFVLLVTRATVGIKRPLEIVRAGERLTLEVLVGRRPRDG
ncbi:MAG: S1C family serine protease [Planctomycetaceae bacterium]